MIDLLCLRVKGAVKSVHGRDNSCDTRCIAGKKKRCLLILLKKTASALLIWRYNKLTSSTTTKSPMILQSLLSSSYFLNFNSLFAVIASIGCRYLSANCIISYVEFHRVTTSRGIRHDLNPSRIQIVRQAGRALVVE
jgi:hypothetical protein